MSTTKLTRKEISADPIHDALIRIVEVLRSRARILGFAAIGVIVVGISVYYGLGYLESRNYAAQRELGKAMSYYHGQIDAGAQEDPYALGATPTFRSEEDKYRAASALFSTIVTRFGASKIGVMGRYYLGLCQIHLKQQSEAISSLEAAANNTSDRTVGYLAKKVLANYYVESGEAPKGQEILQGMLKDPQCDLPKEDLQLDLSRALSAQGKRAEALQILKDAQDAGSGGLLQSLIFQELSRIESAPENAEQR